MSNKLTLSDVENIIDIHILEERNILMVVTKPLAIYISEYLDEEYDIVDEDEDLDNDEFYMSIWFDKDGLRFYCESAKGYDGGYKFVDMLENRFVDYFIFTDTGMGEEDAYRCLLGDATWSWCDLVEEVVNEGDKDLEDNNECTCPECVEERMIKECLDFVLNTDCPHCVVEKIVDTMFEFKARGYEEAKEEMMDFLCDD